jgi:hypothetical protein
VTFHTGYKYPRREWQHEGSCEDHRICERGNAGNGAGKGLWAFTRGPDNPTHRHDLTSSNITPIIRRCVVLVSCNHSFNERSHSVDVTGATGIPEAERPNGRKQPAQVKSGGKPEPSTRSRREPRLARSRLDCLKPNPERMINGPVATVVRRRRVLGADHSRLMAGKTARYSIRGDEPVSRDEWAT